MTAPDVHEGEAEGEANATVAEPEGEAEGEKVDEQRYTGAESIWAALKEKHVRLIKSSWIVEHNKTGNPLPRRQELPEEAFISVEELKRQYGDGNLDGVLPIIGISFCWDTAPNPDPRAKQLKTVAAMLEQERPKYAAVGFTEMGVFWDWLSMHQKDPTKFDESETPMSKPVAERAAFEQELKNGTKFFGGEEYEKSRTEEEKESFRFALHETMDLWYAHQGTTVYMLTKLPEGTTRTNGYDESGWTTYERCSAEQIKKVYLYEAKWKLVLDLGASDESDQAAKARKWPHSPDDFDQLIGAKKFTNGADQETVKKLFRKMSTNQLGYIQLLDFTGIAKPTVEDAKRLGRCLNLCKRLDKLDLNGVGMDGETCKAMLSTLTTAQFKKLELGGNNLGPKGGAALAEGLKGNSTLQSLSVDGHALQIDELKGTKPTEKIDLSFKSLGDASAIIIASCIKENGVLKELELARNRIGDEGASALAEGLKGNSTLQSLNLANNQLCGLDWRGHGTYTAEGITKLCEGLKGSAVTSLNLAANSIGAEGATKLAAILKETKIEKLELWNNNIGPEGGAALAEGLKGNSTLQSLDVCSNNIMGDAADHLAKVVLEHAIMTDFCGIPLVSLRENSITELNLGGKGVGVPGAIVLSKLLPSAAALTSLNLEGNSIGGYYDAEEKKFVPTTEGITKLCEGLKKSSVTSLNLQFNDLGPEGGAALAEGLKGNSTLQSLDLARNNIGVEGASKLAAVLKETKIEKLDLYFNQIGAQGASALAAVLKETRITNLDLACNYIRVEGASKLAAILKETKIEKLELQYNDLNDDAKKVLRDAAGSDIKMEF